MKLTGTQKSLAFLLIVSFMAGVAGVVYLINIPADPKNSLFLGFSLFRLVECLGLLIAALSSLFLLIFSWRTESAAEKTIQILGWGHKYPWSVVTAWLGFGLSLLAVIYAERSFPLYTSIFQRLQPVFFWIVFVGLALPVSYVFWIPRKEIGSTFLYLIKTSLIVSGLIILVGMLFYPAEFGLLLRQGSLLVLVILFFNLVFAFQRDGLLGYAAAFVIVGLLFGGSILGVWSSAVSDLNIITGLLPFNDANGYYHGGRALAEGQLMFPFAAKRPLFSALMGTFLWLTEKNLKFTIGIFVLIGGLAAYFSSREIRKNAGAFAAAFFVVGIFIFSRRFIGSTMSEVIGLPLGTIGFALLWRSAVHQRLADMATGMLMVSLGLLSRAGPFFLLPLLILWAGWGLRGEKKFNWKAVFISGGAVAVGFVFNSLIYTFLAGTNSAPMGNFSYTIYGLVVGGKGWKQYLVDHPEVLSLVEPAYSQAIYRYAWEAFIFNPLMTVQGAFRYWGAFFTFEWYGAFGYIDGASKTETLVGRIVMAILSLGGIGFIIKEFRKPVPSMVLAGLVGIFLSVPFVPPLDAEIRTYAAAIPWFISLGMIGLIGLLNWLRKSPVITFEKADDGKFSPALGITAISLVFLMIFAPLIIHAVVTPFNIPSQSQCSSTEDAVITTVHHGSYINIREDDSIHQTLIPDIRYSDFMRSMHDSPMYSLAVQLIPVEPGMSFLTGYDMLNMQHANILAPTDLLEQNQGWVEFCGWQEIQPDEYGFFHATSVRVIHK